MAFVPEGQADSSQARSASGIDVKRLRPGGTVEVIVSPSVSRIGSIVPLDGAIFLVIPGTSCLATTVLSLRDKTNRHRSASHYLRAPGLDPPVAYATLLFGASSDSWRSW
jgi:hypothetical protein